MKVFCNVKNGTENTAILKIEGAKNWNVWKFQTKVILKSMEIFDIVDGSSIKPTNKAELKV